MGRLQAAGTRVRIARRLRARPASSRRWVTGKARYCGHPGLPQPVQGRIYDTQMSWCVDGGVAACVGLGCTGGGGAVGVVVTYGTYKGLGSDRRYVTATRARGDDSI